MAASKKGMSALQLQRLLGTNYETAWFLFHRLRESAADKSPCPIGGAKNVVKADATYIGGKAKNEAFGPPPKKTAVVSLVERGGETRCFHVAHVDSNTLRAVIVKHASRKSYLMTDESLVYPKIGNEFSGHGTVSEAHLHRYLAEFDFRAHCRNMSDAERADALLKGAEGKRLMYRQSD